ncbi:MAG TPA: three-Cys-motif partner protein TcmP [Chryseolinea sp.]|nr:three-Cys-motif partner protein TcmP [Chryseolinea sp.]
MKFLVTEKLIKWSTVDCGHWTFFKVIFSLTKIRFTFNLELGTLNIKPQTSNGKQLYSDDGFSITATEPWFKVKVQLLLSYIQSFTVNVSGKADEIVFVDLFSGSGLYSVGHQKEIFQGTCLASLSSDLPITKWIFCEQDLQQAKALKIRVNKYHREKNVVIFDSPLDELIDKFRSYIPPSKGGHKVAVLCLIDPFSVDIPFATIDKLSGLGFSFLMPFTFMISNRLNHRYYLHDNPEKFKRYVGTGNFERMQSVESNEQFYKRLVRLYQNSMLVTGLNSAISTHKLDSKLMDLPAYSIGFFSKHFSSRAIQSEIKVSEHLQFELF